MVSEKSLSFRGRLSRLTVRCPGCRQVWLAPGLSGGDKHICKKCGVACVSAGPEVARRPPGLPRLPALPNTAEARA